jgi:FPC/CPF motif-containing protein YcgG
MPVSSRKKKPNHKDIYYYLKINGIKIVFCLIYSMVCFFVCALMKVRRKKIVSVFFCSVVYHNPENIFSDVRQTCYIIKNNKDKVRLVVC